MQSSMWANSSSAVSQYQQQQPHQTQQQQQTQQHQHQYQQEALSAPHGDVCPHLKVMRRGPDAADIAPRRPPPTARVWSPQPLPPPPQFTSPAGGGLESSSSFTAIVNEEEATTAVATATTAATAADAATTSFPLLSINNSLRDAALAAQPSFMVPLVTRQQSYLQRNRQQLLSQQPLLQQPDLSLGPGAEAALRLKLQRKRIRYRALILIYLSCMLLFVLAVVFLAALGVFHTAGSTEEPVARIDRNGQSATAGVGKGASP